MLHIDLLTEFERSTGQPSAKKINQPIINRAIDQSFIHSF